MPWTRHAPIQARTEEAPGQILTRTYYARRPLLADPRSFNTTKPPATGPGSVRAVFELPDGFAWDRPRLSVVRDDPTAPDQDEIAAHHQLVAVMQNRRDTA